MKHPALPWVLCGVPYLALVATYLLLSHNLPYLDQWEFVPFLEKFHGGTLTPGDFWAQHNEHRLVFPRVIMLLLAWASAWNIYCELAVNFLLASAIFALFALHLRFLAVRLDLPGLHWLLPLNALLVFALSQWQNFFSGWQLQAFLSLLAALGCLLLLSSGRLSPARLSAALCCGIAATFSFANGILLWPLGFVILCLRMGLSGLEEARLKWPAPALWGSVGAAIVAAYLWGYKGPAYHPALGSSAENPGVTLLYFLAYLGSPLATYSKVLAVCLGGTVLAAWLWCTVRLIKRREYWLLALWGVGAYSVGSALLTCVARSSFGVDQALSSRYVTLATPVWLAMSVFCAVLALRSRRPGVTLGTALLLVFVGLITFNSGYGAYRWSERYHAQTDSRGVLLSGTDPARLRFFHPDPEVIIERRAALRRLGLSVFRESEGE